MMRRSSRQPQQRSTPINSNTSHRVARHRPASFNPVRIIIAATFCAIVIGVGLLHIHLLHLESAQNGEGDHIFRGNPKLHEDLVMQHKLQTEIQMQIDSIKKKNAQLRHDSNVAKQTATYNTSVHIPGRGDGSKRGFVQCDEDVSSLVSYWNDPRSDEDVAFHSPFITDPTADTTTSDSTRYLSFEPDCGGWNNIRMEFEIMVVFAAATGRTLILPPDHPLYLLRKDKIAKHRGLQNFFQYGGGHHANGRGNGGFDDIVDTITMDEFFQKEIVEKKSYPLPTDGTNLTKVMNSLHKCDYRLKSEKSCIYLFDHLANIADYVPNWMGERNCLIMDDEQWFRDKNVSESTSSLQRQLQRKKMRQFCDKRIPIYYDREVHNARFIHFRSHLKDTRLLVHFYAFLHFTNERISNYHKRLVRDRVRYADEIFCAGGKIVKALLRESNNAGYSSMHIRRGDFQWPKMRISAEEWVENTRHIFQPGEIIYIATDETNRTFFEPLEMHYRLRFLTDYNEYAGLDGLDPNFVGMIDQVVASKGRQFVGTYFSSFSAFIGRMRGYHGYSGRDMHYGQLEYQNETHHWVLPHSSYSAREFPVGYMQIDGDTEPEEGFYKREA